jgi:glycosyltransferase involved in cell wall biosynthesis
MPLYIWNKKVRAATWKRPLIEARQMVRTGAGLASALRTLSAAQRWDVDLVHSNTLLVREGARVAGWRGIAHVWHARELLGDDAPFQLPLRGAALARYLGQHSSVVVANSDATARRLGSIEGGKLVVCHNGVDVAAFARPRPPRRTLVVAMVANLTSRMKKHGLFVAAAACVDRTLDVEFRIYGHGDARDPYVAAIEADVVARGLAARFKLAGFVDDPPALMSEIDLLVHPAEGESFGRIVIEAAAAGVPTVGVAAGGAAELVVDGETGLLAPVGDAAALGARIERLIKDGAERGRLGAAARARARDRFSIGAHVERMLAIYAEALTRPLASVATPLARAV